MILAESSLASRQIKNIWNKTLHRAAGDRGASTEPELATIPNVWGMGQRGWGWIPDVENPKYEEQEKVNYFSNTTERWAVPAEPREGEYLGFFLSMKTWEGLKSHPSWSKARGFASFRGWANCAFYWLALALKGGGDEGEKSQYLGQWEQGESRGWEQDDGQQEVSWGWRTERWTGSDTLGIYNSPPFNLCFLCLMAHVGLLPTKAFPLCPSVCQEMGLDLSGWIKQSHLTAFLHQLCWIFRAPCFQIDIFISPEGAHAKPLQVIKVKFPQVPAK